MKIKTKSTGTKKKSVVKKKPVRIKAQPLYMLVAKKAYKTVTKSLRMYLEAKYAKMLHKENHRTYNGIFHYSDNLGNPCTKSVAMEGY